MDIRLERYIDAALAEPSPAMAREISHAAGVPARPRLNAIDFLRGLVMIVMVLDHTRDFVGMRSVNPRDVHEPVLFLTRWITHFSALIFVFLAGTSAFLYGNRGRSSGELNRFLLTRGVWLVIVEMTLVRLGWTFSLSPDFLLFQVIWAISASMTALSGLVFLPRWSIGAFGLALVFGQNCSTESRPPISVRQDGSGCSCTNPACCIPPRA
jgi:uncharacterized membrane protein